MIGIYFSGTGNTRHCIEKLMSSLDASAKSIPLESKAAVKEIKNNDTIIFGYPIQYSNMPYFVRDFISKHSHIWKGKKILCVATMGLFSGDGAGCAARLLKKYGAQILGGLHIRMPDSVCDSKMLQRYAKQNKQIIADADAKIESAAEEIKKGKYPQEGITLAYHMTGLLGQRLWFYGKTSGYSDKLKVSDDCIGCGLCAEVCPMENILISGGKAAAGDRCTMCYRCISRCPKQALTLIGNKVIKQYRYEKYV